MRGSTPEDSLCYSYSEEPAALAVSKANRGSEHMWGMGCPLGRGHYNLTP